MKFAIRSLVPALAAALIAACDAEVLGPNDAATPARSTVSASLSTSPVSPSRISLAWPDGVPNETGWEIHRSTAGATGAFTLRASLPANTTSYSDEPLESSKEYCYEVRSFRTTGAKRSYAAFTNVACSTTLGAPSAPSQVEATPGSSTTIDVSWNDNSSDEQSFRVERAPGLGGPWTPIGTVPANARTFSNGTGIAPEQQTCYQVIAMNAYGESASTIDCTAAPRAPSEIWASSGNAASIDLTWIDASTVEDGYEVQRRLSNSAWQVIANLPANATTLHDAAILADATYEYRARARHDGGFSDFSAVVTTAAASRPPDAASLRAAYASGSTVVEVSWSGESPLATEFRVERSTDGQLTWITATLVRPGKLVVHDSSRIAEQQVCYRVVALNALGDSPPSNVDCTTPLANPIDVRVTYGSSDGWPTVLVSWFDRSSVEEGFEIVVGSCSAVGCRSRSIQTVPYYQGGAMDVFLYLDYDEYIEAVYAYHGGGYSDPGIWAASEGTAPKSAASVIRPTKNPTRSPSPGAGRGSH